MTPPAGSLLRPRTTPGGSSWCDLTSVVEPDTPAQQSNPGTLLS
jgi:hypothetical protein